MIIGIHELLRPIDNYVIRIILFGKNNLCRHLTRRDHNKRKSLDFLYT